jgi:hypothetical protein
MAVVSLFVDVVQLLRADREPRGDDVVLLRVVLVRHAADVSLLPDDVGFLADDVSFFADDVGLRRHDGSEQRDALGERAESGGSNLDDGSSLLAVVGSLLTALVQHDGGAVSKLEVLVSPWDVQSSMHAVLSPRDEDLAT